MKKTGNNSNNFAEKYAEKVYKYRWFIIPGTILIIAALLTGTKYLKMNTSYRVWFNEGSDEVVQYDKFRKRFAQDDVLIVAFTNEIRSVFIKDLPSSIKFPDSLDEKIKYNEETGFLYWKGEMHDSEKDKLIKLSKNNSYKAAINILYNRAREKGLLNNTTVPMIQRLTKKFWRTKYVTRVDSLTNYSHTNVDGDDLKVKDFFEIKNPGHEKLKEIFSPHIINENQDITTVNPDKKNGLISDLLHSILPYSQKKVEKIIRSDVTGEEMADLIAAAMRIKLPLSRQEMIDFTGKYISRDKKIIDKFIQKFYPGLDETKYFLKSMGIKDEAKTLELAKKILRTRLNLKEVITPYLANKTTGEKGIFQRLNLWVFPHLSAIESPEQVTTEIRSFLDKLPPGRDELAKMIIPHVTETKTSEILTEVLQTKFPPYYNRDRLKNWLTSAGLSDDEKLEFTTEAFIAMLPFTENEATNFVKKYISKKDFNTVKEKLWPELFYTDDDFTEKLKITGEEKLIKDLLISKDGTTTQILITPKLPDNSQKKNLDFLARIKKILLNEETRSGFKFHVAGLPEMSAAFTLYINKDLKLMLPLMFGFIILTILYLFRSVWGVVTAMLVVLFSIMGTLGIMGFIGYEQNNVTAMIPQILMAIGIADSIHILTIFYRELHLGKNKKEAMVTSLKLNLLPVFLTSLTTSVGFLSLLASVSPPIRVLGVVIAIGAVIAFLITATFLPAMLSVLKFSDKTKYRKERDQQWSYKLANFVINYRNPILITFTFAVFISVFFITRIHVDNNPVNYFQKGTYFRDAMDFVDHKLKGTFIMDISVNSVELPREIDSNSMEKNILTGIKSESDKNYLKKFYSKDIKGKEYILKNDYSDKERARLLGILTKNDIKYKLPNKPDGIKNPKFLKSVEKFQEFVESQKDFKISHTSSLVDIIKTVNQRLNKNRPEFYRIPDEQKIVAEDLFLYTNSVAFGRDLNNQINVDQSAIRITLRKARTSSEESIQVIKKMQNYIDRNMKEYAVDITGRATIFTYMGPKITKNMVLGIIIALFVITIILTITFKSIAIGALSLIPNVLPLVMMFGLIGLTGVNLNMGVSMVAMVALGIVVDDTIHFIAKYLRSRKAGKSVTDSIHQTFHDVGSAILFTSVILAIGFGIFVFSNFVFSIRFGTFTSFTMAAALVLDLMLLPAILLLFAKKNKDEINNEAMDQELAYEKN